MTDAVSIRDQKYADRRHHRILSLEELATFRTQLCEVQCKGSCALPDQCPKSHCLTWQRRNPMKSLYSPTLCPDIEFIRRNQRMTLVRKCNRGRSCPYAHSKEEELYHPMVYKTKTCKTFPNCNRFYCPFAHSNEELRTRMTANCYRNLLHLMDKSKGDKAVDMSAFYRSSLSWTPNTASKLTTETSTNSSDQCLSPAKVSQPSRRQRIPMTSSPVSSPLVLGQTNRTKKSPFQRRYSDTFADNDRLSDRSPITLDSLTGEELGYGFELLVEKLAGLQIANGNAWRPNPGDGGQLMASEPSTRAEEVPPQAAEFLADDDYEFLWNEIANSLPSKGGRSHCENPASVLRQEILKYAIMQSQQGMAKDNELSKLDTTNLANGV